MAAALVTISVAWAFARAGGLSSRTHGLKPIVVRLLSLSPWSLLLWSLLSTHALLAQAPKLPEVGYVYPPVVQIGATTDVTLGGYDWTDDLQWFVHHPQVQLETLGPPGEYVMTPPPYWVGQPGARYPAVNNVARHSLTKAVSASPSRAPIPPHLAGSFSARKAWTFSR